MRVPPRNRRIPGRSPIGSRRACEGRRTRIYLRTPADLKLTTERIMQIKVPFFDLKSHHASLRSELNGAIQEVIDEGAFAGGPFVARFEADFAAYCDCPHAIGVGSGTGALAEPLVVGRRAGRRGHYCAKH